ncbi:MAG: hypothetical protein N3F67_06425, partial [Acidilobaceae archaeon]|nr:hypothetical protein [Acidilobaceae archaeon]
VYNSLIFGERVRKRLAVIAEVLKLPEEKVISYANRNVEGFKVRSVQRVIETCEKMKTMKLVDFHYNFEKIAKTLFDIWWSIWEDRDEREKMKKFGETFKTMTVEQLLASWDNVKHELMLIEKKYNRRGALVPAMKSAFKEQTHLRTALVSELKTILMERLGAEEDNVNTLLQDLPMLLYLEYSNRDY